MGDAKHKKDPESKAGETVFHGIPVSPGIAIGAVWSLERNSLKSTKRKIKAEGG